MSPYLLPTQDHGRVRHSQRFVSSLMVLLHLSDSDQVKVQWDGAYRFSYLPYQTKRANHLQMWNKGNTFSLVTLSRRVWFGWK